MADDWQRQQQMRRYAVLSKETIRTFAESAGHSSLSDEVTEILAEDVSYRLRDLIKVKLLISVLVGLIMIKINVTPQSAVFCQGINRMRAVARPSVAVSPSTQTCPMYSLVAELTR